MLVAGMVLTGCVKKTEGEAETSAASATDQKEEVNENIIDEGDDTPIEITKYSKYTGPNHENFLRPGDKIAVISPSALPTQEQTDATVKGLKAWGYVPVEGKYVCPEVRTLENCCEDLEWALTDPEIKGIFCVRGGFASCEVMEAIDRDLIKKAKKPIIGFSDISACHSAWTVQGLPSIHASMSGAFTSLPEECVEVEKRMLQGEMPALLLIGKLASYAAILLPVFFLLPRGSAMWFGIGAGGGVLAAGLIFAMLALAKEKR